MSIYVVRADNGSPNNQKSKPKIANLTIDASISETHKFESVVPEYAVEDGSVITDTVINRPAALDMRGVVAITGGETTRADDALKELLTIRDNKEVITVVTSAKTYTNMILKSLTIPRDKSNGESLVFSASFQEIIFADVQTVTIEKVKPVQKAEKKAAPKKEEAEQPTTEPDLSVQGLMDELNAESSQGIFASESTRVVF